MQRRLIAWLATGVVGLSLLGWYVWTRRHTDQLELQTAEITRGPIVRRVVVAGTLQAVKSIDVGSQVSGQIKTLMVDFNSLVKSGQVIAQIDPEPFKAALDNAKAALGSAEGAEQGYEVEVLDTTEKLTRAKALVDKQLLDRADFDAARIAYDSAVADVESGKAAVRVAKANVNQAQTNLDHTVITSPVDGIVVNRAVDVGQTVAASMTAPVLYTIAANIENMQVQAQVDESDIGSVKEGQPVTFEVESYPDQTFRGTVYQLRLQPSTPTSATAQTATGGPLVSSASNGITYTVIVNVPNPDDRLRPGMTATVLFTSSSPRGDVTRIPNVALLFRPSLDLLKSIGQTPPPNLRGTEDEDTEQVWTFDGKRFVAVPVQLGLSDAQYVEQVKGTLKPGDTVVTNALFGRDRPKTPAPAR